MCRGTFLFCTGLYSKFHSSELVCTQADDQNYDEEDIEQDHDERGADETYDDSIELRDGLNDEHLVTMKNGIHGSSFTGALHILCNEV